MKRQLITQCILSMLMLLFFTLTFANDMTELPLYEMKVYSGSSTHKPCSDLALSFYDTFDPNCDPNENFCHYIDIDESGKVITTEEDLLSDKIKAKLLFGEGKTCGRIDYFTAEGKRSVKFLLTWDKTLFIYTGAKIIARD